MKNKTSKTNNVDKLIFVDNLEVTFSGCLPIKSTSSKPDHNGNKKVYIINSHSFIEYQTHGNKFYQNIADLWIDQRKIGEFRFSPRKAFIDNERINFKFENVQLYQQNFTEYIDSIAMLLGLEYLYVSHIEIALDCVDSGITDFIDKYLLQTKNGKKLTIRHKGRIKRSNLENKRDGVYYWGDEKSDRYIKIYNKTEELKRQKSDKPYIPACWKENGMDTENKIVERFELTLKQKHSKLLDYRKLCVSDYLASILKTHCKNFFDFERTKTNHHKKYKVDVTPINFNVFNTVLLETFRYEEKNTLNSPKQMLKALYQLFLQAKYIASDTSVASGIITVDDKLTNYQDLYRSIESILYIYPPLQIYFNSKRDGWKKEFSLNNELANSKISISEFSDSIELTQNLQAGIEEPKIYDTTDEETLKSYRKNDWELVELGRACDNIQLKQLAKKSKTIGRMSKPVTEIIDKNMRSNANLRRINKA